MNGPVIHFANGTLSILARDPADGYYIHALEADMLDEGFQPTVSLEFGVILKVNLERPQPTQQLVDQADSPSDRKQRLAAALLSADTTESAATGI